jgi:5-methylthioribose kinase
VPLAPCCPGALLANFFLSYLSQPGHKNGAEYAQWVLDQAVEVWTVFTQTFLELWEDEEHHRGEMFKR